MKDMDLKEQLFADILNYFSKYYGFLPVFENNDYITVICPSCREKSAFIYKNNPTLIKCNRLNYCKYEENHFSSFMQKYKEEMGFSSYFLKNDSKDTLIDYLKERKVEKILENSEVSIQRNSRNEFIYDFKGYKITHDPYSLSSIKYKKPKGKQEFIFINPNKDSKSLYIVEGIFDLFSLVLIGKNTACTLGSLSQDFLLNVKNLLIKGTYKKLVLCFDNDEAGFNYTSKTIEYFKDMDFSYEYINWDIVNQLNLSAKIKDINDLFRVFNKQEIKELNLFTSGLEMLKKEAIGEFYKLSAKESFDLYHKTPRLWFKNFGVNLYNGLNVVGARTSNFKTSFMLNLFNASLEPSKIIQFNDDIESSQKINIKSVFITLEEDIGNTIKKLDYINFQKVYTKEDLREKEDAYIHIYNKLLAKESPLIALDYNDWGKIYSLISNLIRLGFNLFFIDYLQLIQNTSMDIRYQALGDITSTLNRLGNQYGVYFLLGSQLTERNFGSQGLPSLDMLRESSNIANDAKNIYLLEYLHQENVVLICNPKNRYALKSYFKDDKDNEKKISFNRNYVVDKFKIVDYREPEKKKGS